MGKCLALVCPYLDVDGYIKVSRESTLLIFTIFYNEVYMQLPLHCLISLF